MTIDHSVTHPEWIASPATTTGSSNALITRINFRPHPEITINHSCCTVSQKATSILLPITLADIDGFSKFCQCWIHQGICNKVIVAMSTTKNVLLHYLVKWLLSQTKTFYIKTIHSTSVLTIKCHFMTNYKCKLQRLFEMSPFCMDTGTKSSTPLVDRVVDDALLQTASHVNQTLLPIVNVLHLRPINMVLHRTPHFVVRRVEVWAVGRSQIGSDERRNLSPQ